MTEPLFDPAAMLAVLAEADVRFVLIGGMAAVLHGDGRMERLLCQTRGPAGLALESRTTAGRSH